MTSNRHNLSEESRGGARSPIENDAVLDAARDCVLAVGVRRTTLSDVARRAGVTRMTIYRRWPDVRTLVGDLMTREWVAVAAAAATEATAGLDGSGGLSGGIRERIVAEMTAGARAL